MPDVADPIAAIVALLGADGGVSQLAPLGVHGGELPDVAAAAMPGAALVVAASGGVSLAGASKLEHDTSRVDLFAYAATQQAASQLLATASLALRRIQRTISANVLIHWVRSAGGATVGRDPSLAWPRAFQSFQVFHTLETVS